MLTQALKYSKMISSSINESVSLNWRIYHDPSGQGRTGDMERENMQWNSSIFWQQLLIYYKEHIVKLFRLQLLTCPLKFLCNKEEISLAQLQL